MIQNYALQSKEMNLSRINFEFKPDIQWEYNFGRSYSIVFTIDRDHWATVDEAANGASEVYYYAVINNGEQQMVPDFEKLIDAKRAVEDFFKGIEDSLKSHMEMVA